MFRSRLTDLLLTIADPRRARWTGYCNSLPYDMKLLTKRVIKWHYGANFRGNFIAGGTRSREIRFFRHTRIVRTVRFCDALRARRGDRAGRRQIAFASD